MQRKFHNTYPIAVIGECPDMGRDEPVDDGSPVRGSTSPTRDYDASIDRQWVLSTRKRPVVNDRYPALNPGL